MEYLLIRIPKDEQVYLNNEPVGTTNSIIRLDAGYVFIRVNGYKEQKVLVQNTTLENPKVIELRD